MVPNKVTEIYKFGNRGIPTDADEPYYDLVEGDYENLDKIMPVSCDFDGAHGSPDGGGATRWGQPLKPNYIPKRIIKKGAKRPIADIDKLYDMFLVSVSFRLIVESVEPGVHQFFPVDVYWPGGEPAESKYYWFNICVALDTVDANKTKAPQRSGTSVLTGKFVRSFWKIDNPGGEQFPLYYSLDAVQGHHIWKDKYTHSGFYCSEHFKKACEGHDLAGLGFSGPMEAS